VSVAINKLGQAALEIDVKGKLEEDDYEDFVPAVEDMMREHGTVGLLIHLEEFRGWSLAALWEDLKFDFRHYRDISRMALVSAEDSQLKERMTALARPFTDAEIEYFPQQQISAARAWVAAGSAGS
jgi:hypothetical protein